MHAGNCFRSKMTHQELSGGKKPFAVQASQNQTTQELHSTEFIRSCRHNLTGYFRTRRERKESFSILPRVAVIREICMFHSFFEQFFSAHLKSRTTYLISGISRKLRIASHPRVWMFFTGLLLVIVSLLCIRPEFARNVGESFPISEAHATTSHMTLPDTAGLIRTNISEKTKEHSQLDELKQKQRVANWISKRYRIAGKASNLFVSTAYRTAFELGLDPHLILAVVAIESRFNPYAESSVGAQGLMQVMAKVHADKFEDHGGIQYALDPVVNIKVGSRILKDYVTQKGSIELALKSYVGAAAMSHDGGYGSKVLTEYRKLKAVASGSHAPAFVQAKSPAKGSVRQKNAIGTIPLSEPGKKEKADDSILL